MTSPAVAYRVLARMAGSLPKSAAAGSAQMTQADVKKLLTSEAASNPKHPEHKATRAQLDAFYQANHGHREIR